MHSSSLISVTFHGVQIFFKVSLDVIVFIYMIDYKFEMFGQPFCFALEFIYKDKNWILPE